MAKKKDKIYWVLQEKTWFSQRPLCVFSTEKQAEDARDLIFEASGLAKSKWSVQRVELLTFDEFASINYL
jgi:hypothetical protein